MVEPVKLVICDIDGTLVGKDEILHEDMYGLGERLAQGGILLTVATGRVWSLAEQYVRKLGATAPAIVANGGLIVNVDGERMRSLTVPLSGLDTVLTYALKEGLSVSYAQNGIEYMAAETDWLLDQQEKFGKFGGVRPLSDDVIARERVEKISIVNPLKDERTLHVERLMAALDVEEWAYLRYHVWCVEIGHPGATKESGMAIVADRLGIPRSQVMAIGNDLNDIELLTQAGVGVAVGNAFDHVKDVADASTNGDLHVGVLEAIDRYIPHWRGDR